MGRSEEWEDTEPQAVEKARRLCFRCPVIGWCRDEATRAVDAGLELEGVWHGISYG